MTGAKNEFGRIFQGFTNNNVERLYVLKWIPKSDIPHHKIVTYPRYTAAVRPDKTRSIASELLLAVIVLTMLAT